MPPLLFLTTTARYDKHVTPHSMRGPERGRKGQVPCRYFWIPRQAPGHPAPRCGVQKSASCGYCLCRYSWIPHQAPGHPAPRCGVQRGAAKDKCRCRYFWIPHQVRNDGTAGSSKGVTPHSDAGSICRYFWIPHQVRNDREGISGFRVVARYDVEHRIKRSMTWSTAV